MRGASAKILWLQGAAADAETKSEELSGAVEELHKLLKEAGEGTYNIFKHKVVTISQKRYTLLCNVYLSSSGGFSNEEREEDPPQHC